MFKIFLSSVGAASAATAHRPKINKQPITPTPTNATKDLVTSLPGLPQSDMVEMWSGYIPVGNKNLFYVYIPCENKKCKEEGPVTIWFTGGPGCSGIAAFFEENGPFMWSDGNLKRNYWSWSKVSNIIWLEQPAGVGYSYTTGSTLSKSSDTQSGIDNYQFVTTFINDLFPELQGRDFWITGESYAGVFGPLLAKNILEGHDEKLKKNFKGMMLGNACLYCPNSGENSIGFLVFQFHRWYYSGLVSYKNWYKWMSGNCDMVIGASVITKGKRQVNEKSYEFGKCGQVLISAYKELGVEGQQLRSLLQQAVPHLSELFTKPNKDLNIDLDSDNLFQDLCTGNASLAVDIDREKEDCQPAGEGLIMYLNSREVQSALHVRQRPNAAPWSICTFDKKYWSYKPDLQKQGMLPTLHEIFKLKPSLSILYYSGDVDIGTVPTQVTQSCLSDLQGVKRKTNWAPWTVNGWHVGYVEVFDRYTFATVKGAGHEVPAYQPAVSYHMYSRFLANSSLAEDKAPSTKVQKLASQGRGLAHANVLQRSSEHLDCGELKRRLEEKRSRYTHLSKACADLATAPVAECGGMGEFFSDMHSDHQRLQTHC